MSYFITCTFDLESADSNHYQNAYEALNEIGLSRKITSDNGKTIQLPNTTTVGEFDGKSCSEVREFIMNKVKAKFNNLSFASEIFITVGGDWCWSHRTT